VARLSAYPFRDSRTDAELMEEFRHDVYCDCRCDGLSPDEARLHVETYCTPLRLDQWLSHKSDW